MMRRPIAKPHHFYQLFCHASPVQEGPEKLLVISILWKAVSDALTKGKDDKSKHDAQVFFREGSYRPFCELVDLDPDWISEVLRDYAGIECGSNWSGAA